jgi:hypothetical protein
MFLQIVFYSAAIDGYATTSPKSLDNHTRSALLLRVRLFSELKKKKARVKNSGFRLGQRLWGGDDGTRATIVAQQQGKD